MGLRSRPGDAQRIADLLLSAISTLLATWSCILWRPRSQGSRGSAEWILRNSTRDLPSRSGTLTRWRRKHTGTKITWRFTLARPTSLEKAEQCSTAKVLAQASEAFAP